MRRARHTSRVVSRLVGALVVAAGLCESPLVPLRVSAQAVAAARSPTTQVAQECFERAQTAYFDGRLAEARRGFECAYKHIPSPEMAWNLARVNERMGEVEEGVRYFRQYLSTAKLSPRERRRVEARISALLELGRRQSPPVALDPQAQRKALSDEARAFFERGTKLYSDGHYKAAAVAFTAALQLSDAPELHYNLAVTAERLGQTADALDHYHAYLDALPEAPDRAEVMVRLDALRNEMR